MDPAAVKHYLLDLQRRIVGALEEVDGNAFRNDAWEREAGDSGAPGGGGITCILEEGKVFERGGVAFSHVYGDKLPPSATAARPELANRPWQAMGVSLVLHPHNPYVPTVHLNVRFFVAQSSPIAQEADDEGDKVAGPHSHTPASQAEPRREAEESATRRTEPGRRGAGDEGDKVVGPHVKPVWWFGGGMDLTPYYGFEKDAVCFHEQCRDALSPFGAEYHPRFKAWCDEYFYLKHRKEPRGIGGIFFDDFHDKDFDFSFALLKSVGDHFLPAYLPVVERRRDLPFGAREREFQAYRRGRYVEFNLVWDRGTLFGLQSGGRTEAILLSMPPRVSWRYDWKPEPGSPEAWLYEAFLRPRDWV